MENNNQENTHKCKNKRSPLWDLLRDGNGYLYCKSCGVRVSEAVVAPHILEEIKQRFIKR